MSTDAETRTADSATGRLSVRRIVDEATKQLVELTGLKPVTISRVFRDEQGWHVDLDMLELSRIPPTQDVLGEYEVLLNDEGSLQKFERKRTRIRGTPSAQGE